MLDNTFHSQIELIKHAQKLQNIIEKSTLLYLFSTGKTRFSSFLSMTLNHEINNIYLNARKLQSGLKQ